MTKRRARRAVVGASVAALLATSCGGSSDQSGSSASSGSAVPDAGASRSSDGDSVPGELSPAEPAVEPGGVAIGSVDVGDVTIEYVSVVPEGFEVGDSAPLLLAFPPGGQDLGLTEVLVEQTYAGEALDRGWVVVSLVAPDGILYFQGSEAFVPGFLDWVESWLEPEGGAPHVVGVSNGGISTFRYAAENSDRVRSIVVFPGFPRSEADQDALASLTGVPVRMFVGGDDPAWIEPAERTVDVFRGLGGDIELTVFPGEGHFLESTADGTLIFDQLDSFRD